VCKFRHLLEEHNLEEEILGTVNLHLQAQGVRITTGTIVDATVIHAPSSTKNRDQSRDPEMPDAQGEAVVLQDESARRRGQKRRLRSVYHTLVRGANAAPRLDFCNCS
jgi:IS5 family transposase